jgi:peptide/nickel transport system substrate-binding protein
MCTWTPRPRPFYRSIGLIMMVCVIASIDAIAAAPARGQRSGVLRVGLPGDLTTLDPHMSTSAIDRHLYYALYNTLVGLDPELRIVPELAISWETPDPRTYIFRLQRGVRFHDGSSFDAAAVKWNIARMQDPATGSIRRSEVANIATVEVIDSHTVQFSLSEPDAALLSTLTDRAGMMVSPAAVDKHGKDFARNPVGTGPFQFVEWVKDDRVRVKRFEGYWRAGFPLLDEVVYRPIPDHTVRLTALRAGDLHIIDGIPLQLLSRLKDDPELLVVETAGLGYLRIELNLAKPPFDNKALRQAVAWAVNREAIHRVVYFGTGAPAQGPIPPRSWAYDPEVKVYATTPDLTKAKQKLAEGGRANGFSFTMNVANTPQAVKTAELIKESLKAAGIEMNIAVMDGGAQIAKRKAGDFEATMALWSGRPDPDGNMFSHFITGGANNWGHYSNPRVDDLLRQARASADLTDRKRAYSEATRLIADDAPVIFLHHPGWEKAWRKPVQGYVEIPDGRMRFERVWLQP